MTTGIMISFEQAAEKFGFSLAYTVALLNSTEFAGAVVGRYVDDAAVTAWMKAKGVNNPLSEEDRAILASTDWFFDDEGHDDS
jgi:hypothetical protein